MMAWALFCHDFDLSKGINILSEKCPVVLDHYIYLSIADYEYLIGERLILNNGVGFEMLLFLH